MTMLSAKQSSSHDREDEYIINESKATTMIATLFQIQPYLVESFPCAILDKEVRSMTLHLQPFWGA